ncbi:TPA: helix-turn-helix transcriptional regulator [Clostridioides difficile]
MNRLKELRINKGFTQTKIAKHIGVSQQAYSFLETGQNKPSLKTAKRISDFFEIPIEKIFFDNKNN